MTDCQVLIMQGSMAGDRVEMGLSPIYISSTPAASQMQLGSRSPPARYKDWWGLGCGCSIHNPGCPLGDVLSTGTLD